MRRSGNVRVMSQGTTEVEFYERFCQAVDCRALFFICSHCDRGQRYCSSDCRVRARREQWRAAARRYQQSPEGRLDHRNRQRSYRQRKATSIPMPAPSPGASVTHQGSQGESIGDSFQSSLPVGIVRSTTQRLAKSLESLGFLLCQFCENQGRFSNPFHVPT